MQTCKGLCRCRRARGCADADVQGAVQMQTSEDVEKNTTGFWRGTVTVEFAIFEFAVVDHSIAMIITFPYAMTMPDSLAPVSYVFLSTANNAYIKSSAKVMHPLIPECKNTRVPSSAPNHAPSLLRSGHFHYVVIVSANRRARVLHNRFNGRAYNTMIVSM
jgi:hypothetical protein